LCPLGLGLEFCDVSALQAQNKITGQSRQILFEGLPPQTQDLHDSFWSTRPQAPLVLVLSPPWRTVLVLVIERLRGLHQRDFRYGPQAAVPLLADHAPYLHSLIHYQISAQAAR
jgi:hypothetical protein